MEILLLFLLIALGPGISVLLEFVLKTLLNEKQAVHPKIDRPFH